MSARQDEWRTIELGQLCREITVGHVGPMASQYTSCGVPFLRSQNIEPFRLDLTDTKQIPDAFHAKLRKSALHPGDVVVVRTGYPGTACVIPETLPEANCADLVIIRPSDELGSDFLTAVFNSTWGRGSVAGNLVGVAQQHFNIGAARRMLLRLPPLPTQRKIAAILSAYDDLIENNTRRIAILEEMARSLYREWFVNFRFPGHEDVAMVESPLGRIPQEWEVRRASDAIQVSAPTRVPKEGQKPFVPMGSLSENSMLIHDIERRTGNGGSKFRNGDTLFARITPCLENGKTGYVQFLPSNDAMAFGSTEFIVLRSRSLTSEFVYLMARSDEFRGNAIKSMSGATGRQRVREECFGKFLFAHPDTETLTLFTRHVTPIFRGIHLLGEKNALLRRTRDLLLPKLVSGELDVSELDIDIGEHAGA